MKIPFKAVGKLLSNYPSKEYVERSSYIFIDKNGEKCYYLAHGNNKILVEWNRFNKIDNVGVSIFAIEEFRKRFRFKKYKHNACLTNYTKWFKYNIKKNKKSLKRRLNETI